MFNREIHLSLEDEKKLKHFEFLREKMFELPEDILKAQLHQLNVLRLSSSNSNQKQSPETLERWNKAQMFIYQNPSRLFEFEFMKEVNSILTGTSVSEVERSEEIYTSGVAFLSNDLKNTELKYFVDVVLPSLSERHPIVASTAIRYWIVSLHPFKDGNGRTSQSLADAWLMMNQFPPLFFKNAFQGAFAYIPGYKDEFSFGDALESSLVGLGNSFGFLL